ncbi:uncharacterized protein LOC115440553 isoform X2 [Manduca sexta]|uniref:Regulatory protein zeste n=2 Tax=Manduca sexta TaxID=7130 RepID=A0A921YVI9_MANSE|nr:uncharacterized protein LOC115440553 isoform X2 [Manduca sexta]KAG6445569.1 hypothetical protein O3G_MSEX003994 [Manduca sexta]
MECRSRASVRQFKSLLEHMERHGDFSVKARREGRLKTQKLWQDLAKLLNSVVGGVYRTPETWKKVWMEWKLKTKKKAALIKRQAKRRNSKEVVTLTDLEERLLFLMNMPANMPAASNEEPDKPSEPVPSTSSAQPRAPSRVSLSGSSTASSLGSMVPYTPPGTPPPTPSGSPSAPQLRSSAVFNAESDVASECSSDSTCSQLSCVESIDSVDLELVLSEIEDHVRSHAIREENPEMPGVRNIKPRESAGQTNAPRLRSQTPTVPSARPGHRFGLNQTLTFDRANHYLRIERRRLKLYLMREKNEARKLEIKGNYNAVIERCYEFCKETFGKKQ